MADQTPPLGEFLERFNSDDNEWWRIECGDHLNLFEAAVAERDAALERIRLFRVRMLLASILMFALGWLLRHVAVTFGWGTTAALICWLVVWAAFLELVDRRQRRREQEERARD